MFQERLNQLQSALQQRQIDCLALIPGANLRYMTGLDFHLMERATIALFPKTGQPVMMLPALECLRFEAARPFDAQVFGWTDAEGPEEAVRKAIMALPEVQRIAVEYLRMRVHELRLVQRHVPTAFMEDAQPVMDTLRLTKTAQEVAAMRKAVAISEAALDSVLRQLEPGMTEREIAARINIAQLERGGGVLPFEPIVLVGPNSALPHGTPGERELQVGDVILFDFGTTYDGYVSDLTRTFVFGKDAAPRQREIYEIVQRANAAGRAAAKPGVPCQDVDRAARRVIEEAGYGQYFVHRVGHGIGLDGHEGPYMREGNAQPLEEGMCFTVEPGIYIPGEIGVRIEDNLVITQTGADTLTTFDRALKTVGN